VRFFVVSVIIILNFIIQSTLFSYIEIFGINPNTAIIIIVCFAMLRFEIEGALIGFFAGLIQDIFFGNVIGLNALLYTVIGYVCGKPFKDLYAENYILPLVLVGGSSLFFNFSYYVLNFLFRARVDIVHYFTTIIMPELLYTLIITMPIFIIIYRIDLSLETRERKNKRYT